MPFDINPLHLIVALTRQRPLFKFRHPGLLIFASWLLSVCRNANYYREGSTMNYTCEPHAVGPYRWNRIVPAAGEMDRHEIDLDAAGAIKAIQG